jgi:Rap1a immunity proteins
VRQLLNGIGVIVVTMLGAYPALVQEDIYSANYVMPGCRDFLRAGTGSAHLGGNCVGLVIGVARYAYEPSLCLPRDVTDEQIVRVVVQYVDNQPARLQEDFVLLATEALRKSGHASVSQAAITSAFDPKRTFLVAPHMSALGGKAA